jgi:hypothetical protein
MNRRELIQRAACVPLAALGAVAVQKQAEAAPIVGTCTNVLVAPDSVLIDYPFGASLAVEFLRNNEPQAVIINSKTKIYIDGDRQNFRELLNEGYARPQNLGRLFKGSLMTAKMKTIIVASRVDFSYS